LARRLHSSWDPEGSIGASLALISSPFGGHNNFYQKNNLIMESMGWADNTTFVLVVELYVQWDLVIMIDFLGDKMASMNELLHVLSFIECTTTANALI
jgi:hypothetical protein